ncbi:MAG: hypothetical protein AB7F72_12645, partial [Afipia sp.]
GMLLQDLDNLLFGKPALTHRLSPGWRTEILTQNRGRFRGAGHDGGCDRSRHKELSRCGCENSEHFVRSEFSKVSLKG